MTAFENIDIPVVVDLDGTLTYSDTLWESMRLRMDHDPMSLFHTSKPALKKEAAREEINLETLPWNHDLLDWLKAEHAKGRLIVLATAAYIDVAMRVSKHLKIFGKVIATSDTTNLKGINKRKAIEQILGTPYIYIGDSRADKPVWEGACAIGLAGKGKRFHAWAAKTGKPIKTWGDSSPRIIKALRPHQWVKNILIFLPLLSSHSWAQDDNLVRALMMFVAFSLMASATYIINDMVDLQDDRTHPRKKDRPLASGRLGIAQGIGLIAFLITASLSTGLLLGTGPTLVLTAYALLTLVYSLILKTKAIVDIATLAGLYTVRIGAGIIATGLSITPWIMMFSFLLFLSLATAKRTGEMLSLGDRGTSRRDYTTRDIPFLLVLGLATGMASVVVFGLYLTEHTVQALYRTPEALFMSVLGLTLWITHIWFKTHRGEMHDDPIVFAFKDKTSLVLGLAVLVSFIIAA